MGAAPMKRTLSVFAAVAGARLAGADAPFRAVAIDSRTLSAGDLFVALPGERVDGHDFVAAAAAAGAAGAVVTRPMPVDMAQLVVDDAAAALAVGAAQWRAQFSLPLVGVAGSNGKTTVKEMIAAILGEIGPCLATRGNLNNHLGVPLTLWRLDESHRSAVIEMGANRRGDVAALAVLATPSIGVITNAGAEHLEGFGSLEGAAQAEGEVVEALPPAGTAVINADDAFARLWTGMTRARVQSFGLTPAADFRAEEIRTDIGAEGFRTRFRLRCPLGETDIELALAGRHNVANALAAAAAGAAAGATLPQLRAGLAVMRAVAGRMQFRLTAAGAWLIDDSYNANPSSAEAAIAVLAELSGQRWMVLGDMAELGEFAAASHRHIGALARARGVQRLYAFGPLAALAADSFGPGAEAYTDADALARSLARSLGPEVRLLIKGSRVNRLERVVNALVTPVERQAG
jgi:UDP-N-acetylmuramoyl-tripeptide--D-alanyl-D-alanine ligase